jgi:hypothetical protein
LTTTERQMNRKKDKEKDNECSSQVPKPTQRPKGQTLDLLQLVVFKLPVAGCDVSGHCPSHCVWFVVRRKSERERERETVIVPHIVCGVQEKRGRERLRETTR